jgi:hypothetical protein
MGEPIVVFPPVPSECSNCHSVFVPNAQSVSISHIVDDASHYRQHADNVAASFVLSFVLLAALISRKLF